MEVLELEGVLFFFCSVNEILVNGVLVFFLIFVLLFVVISVIMFGGVVGLFCDMKFILLFVLVFYVGRFIILFFFYLLLDL